MQVWRPEPMMSSSVDRRELRTRSLVVCTSMPSVAGVLQAGSSLPAPATSTTQRRHTSRWPAWGR